MITNTAGSVDKGSGYKFVLSSARQKLSEDNKDKGLDRCILFPSSLNHKKESFFFFFLLFQQPKNVHCRCKKIRRFVYESEDVSLKVNPNLAFLEVSCCLTSGRKACLFPKKNQFRCFKNWEEPWVASVSNGRPYAFKQNCAPAHKKPISLELSMWTSFGTTT